MTFSRTIGLVFGCLLAALSCAADLSPGSLDVHWDAGATSCPRSPLPQPIQVHRYDAQTWLLREKLCATWEAPFMYLLTGSTRALLIDTGELGDPAVMPLEVSVMQLLPDVDGAKIPLIVVHSHGHLDHRAGDPQFEHRTGVLMVPSDLAHVRSYFAFDKWPDGVAHIDLGGRIVDVIPAPGHHPAQLVYYDRNTGLVFSGDFLLPGRLLVDDRNAFEASARRVAEFLKDRPVSHILGGHIEKNRAGDLLAWQSTAHPDEHVLQLDKGDVQALPAALSEFNGFYSKSGSFVIESPIHILEALAATAALALLLIGILGYRWYHARQVKVR